MGGTVSNIDPGWYSAYDRLLREGEPKSWECL